MYVIADKYRLELAGVPPNGDCLFLSIQHQINQYQQTFDLPPDESIARLRQLAFEGLKTRHPCKLKKKS